MDGVAGNGTKRVKHGVDFLVRIRALGIGVEIGALSDVGYTRTRMDELVMMVRRLVLFFISVFEGAFVWCCVVW
jgi:hypothetical protein